MGTAVLAAEPQPVVPLMYAAMPDEQFPVPAVNISQVDQRFWRTEVNYPTDEKPVTLIVHTPARFRLVGTGDSRLQAQMAALDAAGQHGGASTRVGTIQHREWRNGPGTEQPAGLTRALYP